MTVYVASWCSEGLEGLFNWTADEHNRLFVVLQSGKPPMPASSIISTMVMRARANPQRHYEVYAFNASLEDEEVRELFETQPQATVDWIREHGEKIFSDRANPNPMPVIR